MAQDRNDTKQALLLAAGELFAELGYDGTSVRAIAEKAGANVAAVSYHFGSKEALYVETVRYVIQSDKAHPLRRFLQSHPGQLRAEDVERALLDTAMDSQLGLTSMERLQWRFHLLMRTMFEPVVGQLDAVIDEKFRPDVADMMALARRVVPGISERQALLWAFGFMGHVTFYMFARRPVLGVLGQEEYDPQFLREAGEFAAKSAVAALAALRAERGTPGQAEPTPEEHEAEGETC